MTDAWRLSAIDAARQLAARELSSVELVSACLERIAAREPELRAWAHLDSEVALAQARERDGEERRGPLHGLPVGVKDVIDTADLPTAYGSPIYAEHRPERDADCVAWLREAGAVVLGKTVTTEFATYEPPPTVNPLDPARTPGRLLERQRRGGRRRDGAARLRHPDGRLRDPPGLVLRRRGLQAGARLALDDRDQAAQRAPRHAGAVRPQRRATPRCWAGSRRRRRARDAWRSAARRGGTRLEDGGRAALEEAAVLLGAEEVELPAGVRRAGRGAGDRHGLRRRAQPRAGVARAPRPALGRDARLHRARADACHDGGRRGGRGVGGALPLAAARRVQRLRRPARARPRWARRRCGSRGTRAIRWRAAPWTFLGVPALSVPGMVGPAGMPVGVQLVGLDAAAVLGAGVWVEGGLASAAGAG